LYITLKPDGTQTITAAVLGKRSIAAEPETFPVFSVATPKNFSQ
jgi:hypothetical protein